MRAEAFEGLLGLRIDVDFTTGLDRAVPRMLDELGAAGLRATFFVVAGENHASPTRFLHARYLRRLWKLGPRRVASRLLLPGLRGPAGFVDTAERRDLLRRIVREGHEVALHGYDHAWWAQNVWSADPRMLEEEIDRSYVAMGNLVGDEVLAWGAPGWRTTTDALHHLAAKGVPYLADCWGDTPFRTVDEHGVEIPVPHLPNTLPSLEGLILEQRCREQDAPARALEGRPRDRFDVLCLHDYFEGLLRPGLFTRLVEELGRHGLRTVSLRELAGRIHEAGLELPGRSLSCGPLPGFFGAVSRAGDPAPEEAAAQDQIPDAPEQELVPG